MENRVIERMIKNGYTRAQAIETIRRETEHAKNECGFYNEVDAQNFALELIDEKMADLEFENNN